MNPLTYALINGAIIVLIYVGALRVDYGNLSQGSVLALYNLMTQILVELIKLANLIITVTKAAACGSRIEGVLDMESSLKLLPAGEENTSAGRQGRRLNRIGKRRNFTGVCRIRPREHAV